MACRGPFQCSRCSIGSRRQREPPPWSRWSLTPPRHASFGVAAVPACKHCGQIGQSYGQDCRACGTPVGTSAPIDGKALEVELKRAEKQREIEREEEWRRTHGTEPPWKAEREPKTKPKPVGEGSGEAKPKPASLPANFRPTHMPVPGRPPPKYGGRPKRKKRKKA
jgi:hypothetical protein